MKFITRHLKSKNLIRFGLIAGAVVFLLRLWQQTSGIDQQMLYITAHPARWLLIAASFLALAIFALCAGGVKRKLSYKKRFPPSVPAAVSCWLAAIAAGLYPFLYKQHSLPLLNLFFLALGILAALAFVILGFSRLRGQQPASLFHGCVCVYFFCFALIHYPDWSSTPQYDAFLPNSLAAMALLFTAYYRATLDEKLKNWPAVAFLHPCALLFCLMSIPQQFGWFYLAMALWILFSAPVFSKSAKDAGRKTWELPKGALFCIQSLEQAGFEAYVVGGCVRDHLMGRTPQDYDLCTSATPEEICRIFEGNRLIRNGEKHGTIGVVLAGEVYEITTFRAEGEYSDNRHPDSVTFVKDLESDLKRRDFTINAMAYSPTRGLVDPFGGRQDLKQRILRTVGDPEARFREDALRILRGVRFAARFRLTPEPETLRAMNRLAMLTDGLARERVLDELCKFLPVATAEHLLAYQTVLVRVIPELGACVNFAQYSTHHSYDVYTHTAHVVELVPQDLTMRWAALLHDVAKPEVFSLDENGQGHFRGHAQASAQMADAILLRLKAPNALRERVTFLAEHHMTMLEPNKPCLLRWVGRYGEAVQQLLVLQEADFAGKGTDETTDHFNQLRSLLENLHEEEACLTAKDLKVNGRDILALGMEPGPLVGECMRYLLTRVQEGQTENTRQALLEEAQLYLHSICSEPELLDSIMKEEGQ